MRKHTLKEWRRLRRLTQRELALWAGVRESTVSDIERAACAPHRATVAALAEALGVKVAQLLPTRRRQWQKQQ